MWLSDVDQSDFLECSCCARVHRVHVGVLADLWSVIREPALKIFVMLLAPPPPRRHRPRTDLFILTVGRVDVGVQVTSRFSTIRVVSQSSPLATSTSPK